MQFNDALEHWEKRIWDSMPPPQAGCLLVANPFMQDPNFKRTVLLLVAHDDKDGSLGYVLSKPLEATIGDVAEQLEGFAAPLYQGGPVELNTLHFIHSAGMVVPDAKEIATGIYWAGDFERLPLLANTGQIQGQDFRFFLGYSGWAVGQLAQEQLQRSWLVCAATPALVFSKDTEDVWTRTIKHMGGQVTRMASFPQDPSLN